MRIVFITGLSGAGKTTALRALEDLGFYCVDNLPIPLILEFVDVLKSTNIPSDNIAIVVDVREGEFLDVFRDVFRALKKEGIRTEILFLEARDEVIKRRYSETRRRHPLGDIETGINRERERLKVIAPLTTRTIDTTHLSVHDLRELVSNIFGGGRLFYLNIIAFGFKYGLPENADLVFDVRFLPNPHFVEELRPLTGRDKAVRDFVLQKKETAGFLRRTVSYLRYLIPFYKNEGKVYLTVGFGCTGGKHRSIVIADAVYEKLSSDFKDIRIIYRDMGKE